MRVHVRMMRKIRKTVRGILISRRENERGGVVGVGSVESERGMMAVDQAIVDTIAGADEDGTGGEKVVYRF